MLKGDVIIFWVILAETFPPPFLLFLLVAFGRIEDVIDVLVAFGRLITYSLDVNLELVAPSRRGEELAGLHRRLLGGVSLEGYFAPADQFHQKIFQGTTPFVRVYRADVFEPYKYILDHDRVSGGGFLKDKKSFWRFERRR